MKKAKFRNIVQQVGFLIDLHPKLGLIAQFHILPNVRYSFFSACDKILAQLKMSL